MDDLIEIRYAGTVVAKSSQIRERDATGFFIGASDPMPVGTYVSLKISDQPKFARVEQVVESTDAALGGMRLRFVDAIPARAPAPVPARPVPVAKPAEAPSAATAAVPVASAVPVATAPADEESVAVEADGGGAEGGAGSASDPAGGAGNGGGRRRRRRR